MTKQEFLAASLPYGLKVQHRNDTFKLAIFKLLIYSPNGDYKDYIPIIRPLDSLLKECVQSDYNDGKPFIPIVELVKIAEGANIDVIKYERKNNISGVVYIDIDDIKSVFCYHEKISTFGINSVFDGRFHICTYQLQLFQQLLKWHFWPNMPEGEEVVLVTDEFNPYE